MKSGEKNNPTSQKKVISNRASRVIKTSREAISKYERGEAILLKWLPGLQMYFEVTIDFLMGMNHTLAVGKKTLKRMQDIDTLDDNTKEKLFFLIDNTIQNSKAMKAFSV